MGFDPGDFFKSKELQSYDVLGKVLFSRNDSGCNIRKQVTWSDDWFDLASFKQSFSFFFYYFIFFFFFNSYFSLEHLYPVIIVSYLLE